MELKYCIKQKLEELPLKEYKKIKLELSLAIGKNIRTFERYCNLRIDDFSDIPAKDLFIIATVLSCKIDKLVNYKITIEEIQARIIHKKSLLC